MDSNFFERQIQRLIEVYGSKPYPGARVARIWEKVQHLPNGWMNATVNQFIEYEQYAPLGEKWDEALSKTREHSWEREKKNADKESKEALSRYSNEDISTIMGQIIKRMKGGINDQDWQSFNKMISIPDG